MIIIGVLLKYNLSYIRTIFNLPPLLDINGFNYTKSRDFKCNKLRVE